MLSGRIIAESLVPGTALEFPSLRLVRVSREKVDAAPGQPGVWTLIDVEAPDELADDLAAALAAGLAAEGGWYADFRTGGDHVVVFAGRVVRYKIGDAAGRQAAVDHGAAAGVPASQLDWGA